MQVVTITYLITNEIRSLELVNLQSYSFGSSLNFFLIRSK